MIQSASPLRRVFAGIEFKLIVAWLFVMIVTTIFDPQRTYLENPDSVYLILRNTVLLGFLAIGGGIVIISGGIDLSCGSMMALSATTYVSIAHVLDPAGYDAGTLGAATITIAMLGALTSGVMVGTLHAWLINCVGLPPFVATLSTLVGLRSLASGMTTVFIGKSELSWSGYELGEAIRKPSAYSITFLVLAAILWFVLARTVLGRRIYALGGNEQAARLSGVRTERLKWFGYVVSSVLASIVGIIYFADVSSVKPLEAARGYELNAIAAAVIGGCSLQGGIGTIPGILLGCLLLRTIIDAVNKVVQAGAHVYEGMIVGVVVVLAVTFTQRGTQAIRKRLFVDPLGWCAIPVLGLLGGLISYLFFHQPDSDFTGTHAAIVGSALTACLIARAVWERRSFAVAA